MPTEFNDSMGIDINVTYYLVGYLQLHSDINRVGGQAVQCLDFWVTGAIVQILFSQNPERVTLFTTVWMR